MKITRDAIVLLLIIELIAVSPKVSPAQSGPANIDGFTSTGTITERQWEEKFRSVPSADSARAHLKRLTAEPHVAGTKEDYETAVYVRDRMREYGLVAEIKSYDVLLPYPKQPGLVELVVPRRERLAAKEPVVPEDHSSSNPRIIPLFNCFNRSGARLD